MPSIGIGNRCIFCQGPFEDRWREEEEIAAIVDGELTAVTGLGRLRQRPGEGGVAGGE